MAKTENTINGLSAIDQQALVREAIDFKEFVTKVTARVAEKGHNGSGKNVTFDGSDIVLVNAFLAKHLFSESSDEITQYLRVRFPNMVAYFEYHRQHNSTGDHIYNEAQALARQYLPEGKFDDNAMAITGMEDLFAMKDMLDSDEQIPDCTEEVQQISIQDAPKVQETIATNTINNELIPLMEALADQLIQGEQDEYGPLIERNEAIAKYGEDAIEQYDATTKGLDILRNEKISATQRLTRFSDHMKDNNTVTAFEKNPDNIFTTIVKKIRALLSSSENQINEQAKGRFNLDSTGANVHTQAAQISAKASPLLSNSVFSHTPPHDEDNPTPDDPTNGGNFTP